LEDVCGLLDDFRRRIIWFRCPSVTGVGAKIICSREVSAGMTETASEEDQRAFAVGDFGRELLNQNISVRNECFESLLMIGCLGD
jgi:hypothetical protein